MEQLYPDSEENDLQQSKGHSRSHLSLGQSTAEYRSQQIGEGIHQKIQQNLDPNHKISSLFVFSLIFYTLKGCSSL